ncbi:kinase [Streptomyces gardneri]|nr:kinase [Streptomyces gardneri]
MNSGNGVILFGGPASGKDTVTEQLGAINDRVELYQRIKVGPGRTTGYRMSTAAQLDELRQAGEIIWENDRYDSTYAVDRPELDRMIRCGLVPVIHLGQAAAVDAIRTAMSIRWTVVELWCPLDVARQRIEARQTGDTAARLEAWTQTCHLTDPDLFLDTSRVSAAAAAQHIQEQLWTSHSSSPR